MNCVFLSWSVFGFCTQRSWAVYRLCLRVLPTGNTPSNWSPRGSTTSKLYETEQILDYGERTRFRLNCIDLYVCFYCALKEPDVEKLEHKLSCGQIEEVISQVRWSQILMYSKCIERELFSPSAVSAGRGWAAFVQEDDGMETVGASRRGSSGKPVEMAHLKSWCSCTY